nr:hypothetical protein CFP56_18994 [Quercus suber]
MSQEVREEIGSKLGLEGGKQSLENGDTWGSDNTTCADRQLAGNVRVFSGSLEQVMSEAAGQVMSVLDSWSPSTKAPLDKNDKDSPVKMNAASAVQVGVIFQGKANEKGKQILGKGSLKKVARAKGKASDDQTLAQMMEIGTKRLRAKEASEEENNRAPKRC